jgi:hypothetical protein
MLTTGISVDFHWWYLGILERTATDKETYAIVL